MDEEEVSVSVPSRELVVLILTSLLVENSLAGLRAVRTDCVQEGTA